MELGPKQKEWVEELRSDTPLYTDEVRDVISAGLFNQIGLTELEMATLVEESPETYFSESV